jgi:hypothetical protein
MALYEDGRFVPKVELPIMERLMRNPGNYSVVKFDIAGERAAVVKRLAKGFEVDEALLPVVRSLYARIGSLKKYAEITRSLPDNAIAARDAILRAKSPERLLFIELPRALGCQPFEAGSAKTNKAHIQTFFDALNGAFGALKVCYPDLLQHIKCGLIEIFDIPKDDADWQDAVSKRAAALSDLATDPALRTLINRASDTALGEEEYLESIGQAIVGQPPSRWSGADEEGFGKLVSQLLAKTRAVESLLDMRSGVENSEAWYVVTIDAKQNNEPVRRAVQLSGSEKGRAEVVAAEIVDRYASAMEARVLLAAVAEAAQRVISSDSVTADEHVQNGGPRDGRQ